MAALNFGLENQVVLVTGGSRGIGLEVARLLLAQNARVGICARKAEGLAEAARHLDGGDRLMTVAAHVASVEAVDDLFDAVIDRFGRIDALVNNVGMNLFSGLVDADPGLWQKIIDTNLNGTFLCARKAGQLMRAAGGGKIVSLSSIAARRAAIGLGIYGVAKAGIEMMTRVLAQELAPFNVQVNAVAPCMVRTDFSQPLWSDDNLHRQIVAAIPAGRIAEPQDVAWPVLFLCSDASRFITGQTLAVDGGASAV